MTNLMQDAATWLGSQLKTVAGRTVTYTRGASSVSLTAAVSMHEYQVIDTEGFETQVVSRDYFLMAADLIIGGSVVAPRAGDQITESIGGIDQTFEAMNLGDSGPAWNEADPDGTLIVVHTKRVG